MWVRGGGLFRASDELIFSKYRVTFNGLWSKKRQPKEKRESAPGLTLKASKQVHVFLPDDSQ